MSRRPGMQLADKSCLTKAILIDAIVGAGFPSIDFATKASSVGLAHFSGNQYNESWDWHREMLEQADIDDLHDLYLAICEEWSKKATTRAH